MNGPSKHLKMSLRNTLVIYCVVTNTAGGDFFLKNRPSTHLRKALRNRAVEWGGKLVKFYQALRFKIGPQKQYREDFCNFRLNRNDRNVYFRDVVIQELAWGFVPCKS